MYRTTYHRAGSVEEALERARAGGGEAKYLAGGQTLIATMKQRLAAPEALIDLARIPGLRGIEVSAEAVTIRAATPHAQVAESAEVAGAIPALAALAGGIGDPAVRARGTIGGSVANNDPAADYPAACLALGATIVTNAREIAADDFFTGLFETALEEEEIITAVRFPRPKRAGWVKFPNPASRYALVAVMAAETAEGPRVAVTGAGANGVFRYREAEAALAGGWDADAITTPPSEPMIEDLHASADYRANLVQTLTKRAIKAAS